MPENKTSGRLAETDKLHAGDFEPLVGSCFTVTHQLSETEATHSFPNNGENSDCGTAKVEMKLVRVNRKELSGNEPEGHREQFSLLFESEHKLMNAIAAIEHAELGCASLFIHQTMPPKSPTPGDPSEQSKCYEIAFG